MSLIACTTNYQTPFIVGDLLISNRAKDETFSFPTNAFFDYQNHFREYYPAGLAQKIYIVKKNVCIALAGDEEEMIKFLEEFSLRCSYKTEREITEAYMIKFLNDYGLLENFKNSAGLIMFLEYKNSTDFQDIEIGFPLDKWKNTVSDMFDKVYACGSGKESFLLRITQKQTFESSHLKGDQARAIQANIGLFARLLAEETITSVTIEKNWGAGFETIYYDYAASSFAKFDNITYLVCQGDFNEVGEIGTPFPSLIMHYKYHSDILVISTFTINKWTLVFSDVIHFHIDKKDFEVSHHIAPRIFPKNDLSNFILPLKYQIQSNQIAVGYAIKTPNNQFHYPSLYSASGEITFEYTSEENIEIKILYSMNDLLRKHSKEAFVFY